jgi:hypothetical protein
MRSKVRLVLLAVLLSAATTVTALVVASPAEAAAPPDVTPVKVAATGIGEGHAVYVRGTDARLYWRTVESFTAPGYSTSWRALPGGTVGSGPDAVQIAPTTLYLAARATNSNLLVRRQDGTTFGAWQNLGGVITSAPTLAYEQGPDRLWAFARGGDGAVWYRVQGASGTWAPWQSLGGTVTSAPDVAALFGRVDVYARGLNGNLYQRFVDPSTGVWSPWRSNGYAVNSASSTTSTVFEGDEYRLQYWRGGDRHVYELVRVVPANIGGIATSAPDVAAGDGLDEQLVAVVGTNRALYVHVGNSWTSLGGIAA